MGFGLSVPAALRRRSRPTGGAVRALAEQTSARLCVNPFTAVAVRARIFGETPSTCSSEPLANWWKGRDSNPRPRHYEPANPLRLGSKFNNLAKGRPLQLARRSTTEHDRLPQNSRNSPKSTVDVVSISIRFVTPSSPFQPLDSKTRRHRRFGAANRSRRRTGRGR